MRSARSAEANASALEPRRHSIAQDLFPDTLPPRPLPIFPEPNSVKESALLALVAGAIRQSGFVRSWRLAAYVRFLKDDGWEIVSREVAENGRTVAEYALDLQDDATREAAVRYRVRKGGA
jgi:hypothetical protein